MGVDGPELRWTGTTGTGLHEVAIDFGALKTDAEWVKAGELVFNMPFRAAINTAAPAEEWRAEFGGSALYPRAAIDGT